MDGHACHDVITTNESADMLNEKRGGGHPLAAIHGTLKFKAP
jgi:hypothetical protein